MRFLKFSRLGAVAIFIMIFSLSGCTPEKAEALLSAAQVFKNESKKAIAAYEALLLAGLDSPQLSEQEAVADILNRGNSFIAAKKSIEFKSVTLGLQSPFISAKEEITKLVQRQNELYDAFSDSLTNLPRGSFLARDEVQCAEEIARRLVINIAGYHKAIKKHPVNLVIPEEEAVISLEDAIESGDDVKKADAARNIYLLYKKKQQLNEAVIKQSAVAAQSGIKVISAAEKFDSLSTEDMIKLVRLSLKIAGSIDGIDTEKAIGKLDQALTSAQGDKHWKVILAKPVYEAGTKCNPSISAS